MPDPTVVQQMKKAPVATRSTVAAARRMVKAIAPKATEIAYRGDPPRSKSAIFHIARYLVGDAYVVGIGSFTKHVAIYFPRGLELDDGSGLLQGGGKQFRGITLRSPADAQRAAVKRIVRRAFALER